jgi:hypothetical protein
MARFRCNQAVHFGSTRIQAGKTIADTQANAQVGDVVFPGLSSQSLPPGCVPLDGGGTTMKNASPLVNEPIRSWITGADSIG